MEQHGEETQMCPGVPDGGDRKVWATSSWADRDLHCRTPRRRWWHVHVVHLLGQERRTSRVGEVWSGSAWAWSREMQMGNEMPGLGTLAAYGYETCQSLAEHIRGAKLQAPTRHWWQKCQWQLPKSMLREVNSGLWVWSSHCDLITRLQKDSISHCSSSSSQHGLCERCARENYPSYQPEWGWRPTSNTLNDSSVLFCQTITTKEDKYRMCSSGLQVSVCCIE